MRVFIANFGQSNYLWPECLKRSTVATIDNVGVHPFWESHDRAGFTDYAVAHLKTARMETPTRPVASRWFGLNDAIANTNGGYVDPPRESTALVDRVPSGPGADRLDAVLQPHAGRPDGLRAAQAR